MCSVSRALAAAMLIAAAVPTHVATRSGAFARLSDERAIANDNRTSAGTYHGDTLVLRLVAAPAAWHILGDSEPALPVMAFGEEGKPLTIPGPLIRVRVGTPIQFFIRNAL